MVLLSAKTKQAFQAIGVVATVMVVAIHYRSAAPDTTSPIDASWNELAQEFLLGGVGRVAVPLFALAAGLFYFASCDGTFASHVGKIRTRVSTLLAPYLIFGGVAVGSWFAIRQLEGNPISSSVGGLMLAWWLDPPAEQLWFLRDLMVLALLAPVTGWLVAHANWAFIASIATLWMIDVQPFPVVQGWYLINIETLLFFAIGCSLAARPDWIAGVTGANRVTAISLSLIWFVLIAARVLMQPNFDSWYVVVYTHQSLVLHQLSILVGIVACLAWAGRAESHAWPKLSGLAFFVYLVHEFPLRAVVDRFVSSTSLGTNSFWIAAPVVTTLCFLVGRWLSIHSPSLFSVATGGRTPTRAMRIRDESASDGTSLGATT